MCTVFGCILREGQAADLIIGGLKRLEDHGYDSVGIVTINDRALYVRKDQGKLEEVVNRLRVHEMGGYIGVGNTRWATHGAPSRVNAHPHLDGSDQVAVVHNGVIGNYLALREELAQRGHVFVSKTDTEVVPHLMEEELKVGSGLVGAVLRAVRRLKGCYALVVASSNEPEKLFCVRQGRPLILGVGEGGEQDGRHHVAYADGEEAVHAG